jgi:hypothetical protein
MKKLVLFPIFALFLSYFALTQNSQDSTAVSTEDLQKAAQNPLADMVSIPFRSDNYFNMGPNGDRTGSVLNMQPVIPLFKGKVITRTIIPISWVPKYSEESGTDFGMGDILFSAFYSVKAQGLTFGAGPVVSIPTSSEMHGSEKWGLGPSVVGIAMPGRWVLGGVLNNVWSVGGNDENPDVNVMTFQPLINYNFPGFILTYSPLITANWNATSGNEWTVPLGIGVGKLFMLGGKLPMMANFAGYNNVVRPDYSGNWTVSAMAIFLLPTSIF